MSNWSCYNLGCNHYHEYSKFKAAGTNDKKWNNNIEFHNYCVIFGHDDCRTCMNEIFCKRYHGQAANTKPEYTPEQQEMIDWIDAYPYAALGFSMHPSIVETAYKEIINKHRSK